MVNVTQSPAASPSLHESNIEALVCHAWSSNTPGVLSRVLNFGVRFILRLEPPCFSFTEIDHTFSTISALRPNSLVPLSTCFKHLVSFAIMAAHNFAGHRRGIPTSNQRGFDLAETTGASLSLQPAIDERFRGLYSPVEHDDFGQSFASPPQLPPIQPGARQRQRALFSNPANMLSTDSATVSSHYGALVSNASDSLERSMNFGGTSMHGYSGSMGGTDIPA
jgi:hypothetical protein